MQRFNEQSRQDEIERLISQYPAANLVEVGVGPGWLPLVESLCRAIQDLPEKDRAPAARLFITDKHGGIKIEGSYPEAVEDLVDDIEDKSIETCEICGRPGMLRHTGWTRCLCDEHVTD